VEEDAYEDRQGGHGQTDDRDVIEREMEVGRGEKR